MSKICQSFNHKTEVFECSCTERGRKCPSQFTRANAFVPMMKMLERKNPDGVTLQTIVKNAICPFHARMLRYFRTDIVSMNELLSEFFERSRKARTEEEALKRRVAEWQNRRRNPRQTVMRSKLLAALRQ